MYAKLIYIYQTKVGGISLFQVLVETQNVDSLKLKTFYFQTWSLLRIAKVFLLIFQKGSIELQRFVVDTKYSFWVYAYSVSECLGGEEHLKILVY